MVVHRTSGGGELLVAAGREALEEALEDDELTDTLAFLSAAACLTQTHTKDTHELN